MIAYAVKVAGGEGLVARYGGSVVLAPEDSALVDEVLALAAQADREHSGAPGRFLPRRVAGLIAQLEDSPTLALVSALEDGLAVLLVGDVILTLTVDGAVTEQSGRDATTWVDRIVRGSFDSLALSLPGAGRVNVRSDLQAGVVSGSAVRISPVPGAAVEPPVELETQPVNVLNPESFALDEAAEVPLGVPFGAPLGVPLGVPDIETVEVPDFESFLLDEPVEGEPLPVAEPPSGAASEPDVEPGAELVLGIECSRQHFNDPSAIYCSVCGISMVHQTHNLVSGRRPPLGVIVLDDGAVFTLDGDYVLGREPENADEVIAGSATPLALEDPDVTMSRVHAKLLLVGWDVRLMDAGSANGTYVARPGETEWTELPAGESTTLLPGTKVSVGGRTLVFDSHHKL